MQPSLCITLPLRIAIVTATLWGASFCAARRADGETFGPVTVNHIPLYEAHEATRRGYAGHLFQVKNSGGKKHRVRIEWPCIHGIGSHGRHLINNARSVDLAPGQTAYLWIYQPAIDMWGGQAGVSIDGRRQDKFLAMELDHTALNDHEGFHSASYPIPAHPSPFASSHPSHPASVSTTESGEAEIDSEEADSEQNETNDSGSENEDSDGKESDNAEAPESEVSPAEEAEAEAELEAIIERPSAPVHVPAGVVVHHHIHGGMPAGMGTLGMGMGGTIPFTNSTVVILASRRLSGDFRDKLAKRIRDSHIVRSVQQPHQWPTNWIIYSRFDGIVISRGEYDDLSPEAQSALADYLSVGGVVWIRPDSAGKGKKPTTESPAAPATLLDAKGLGTLLTHPQSDLTFGRAARKRAEYGSKWKSEEDAANRMPVTKRKKAPVWAFLGFLVVYAIGIGPVLQIALQRKRRRIWMVWILPATALVLCSAVFVWSYVSEGFHGLANIRTVTLLNQKTQRASTVGWAGFYSPLTDSAGLTFSTSTILQPQWMDERYNDESRSVSIDWTRGQHLTEGWLLAKTPLHFRLWKVESRREKLAIRQESNGTVTATNALGAEVTQLLLCLPDGTWRSANRIPAGASSSLQEAKAPPKGARQPISQLLPLDDYCSNSVTMERLSKLIECKPGSYIALVDGHPFVNTAITNPAVDQGQTLLIGEFELEQSSKSEQ